MRRNLTLETVNIMLKEAKSIFYSSDRPFKEKSLLSEIQPLVYFNTRLRTTWGRAWLCHSYDYNRFLISDLIRRVPRVKVQGRKSWFVLEINPLAQEAPIVEVRDTVSHELAHLLDFRLAGYYDRWKEDHHEGWRTLHLSMGGNGETYGPKIIQPSLLKCKVQRPW